MKNLAIQGSALVITGVMLGFTMPQTTQAAVISYNLSGTVTSGPLLNQTYSGTFSFDDSGLTGTGDEFITVDNVSVNFNGSTFTQANATATPEVAFFDGDFLGLNFSAEQSSPNLSISFSPGFFDVADAFVTYEQEGIGGDGDVTYTQSVPESSSLWGIVGLGLMGLVIKLKNRK